MHVLNQDRDTFVIYNHETSVLTYSAVYFENILMGFNLEIDGNMVGTFDSVKEIFDEMNQIRNFTEEYYIVSGFSMWKEWEELTEDWIDE